MQFVRHGCGIPERLLQVHDDGRLVFFCGAGISYPARLPGFAGLLERPCTVLATTPNAVQKAAIKSARVISAFYRLGLLRRSSLLRDREGHLPVLTPTRLMAFASAMAILQILKLPFARI